MQMNNYENFTNKVDLILDSISECSRILSCMDMKDEVDFLQQMLNQGVFQVMFIGGFAVGRYSLLNALMRKEVISPSIIHTLEHSMITKFVCKKDEKVILYKNKIGCDGKPITEEYTLTDYQTKCRSQELGDFELFSDIDYVQIQTDYNFIGGANVQLICGGLDDITKAARNFAEKASAIVYLIDATRLFTQEDRSYIAQKFANKELTNIFFVINHFDCVAADQVDEIKQIVKNRLKDVFTYNGQFDENMFNERVFYTNAYGSLNARLEKTIKDKFGEEIKCTKEDDKCTGVPEFEEALMDFLASIADDVLGAIVHRLAQYINA